MIQRIQSVLLALVFILGALLFVSPILHFTSYEASFEMNAYSTYNIADHIVISKNIGIGAMQGLIALLALATIFLFKKRQLQIKLCKLNILLIAIQIAAIVFYIDVAKDAISPQNPSDVVLGLRVGIIIPTLSFMLTYLSIWFIKKDEKLIRSADRLR